MAMPWSQTISWLMSCSWLRSQPVFAKVSTYPWKDESHVCAALCNTIRVLTCLRHMDLTSVTAANRLCRACTTVTTALVAAADHRRCNSDSIAVYYLKVSFSLLLAPKSLTYFDQSTSICLQLHLSTSDRGEYCFTFNTPNYLHDRIILHKLAGAFVLSFHSVLLAQSVNELSRDKRFRAFPFCPARTGTL